MAVADRSYSFRSGADFGPRMDHAREQLARLASSAGQPEMDAWVLREFEITLARRLSAVTSAESQSAFMRAVLEALVTASERIEREISRFEKYEAFSASDTEGDDIREALFRQAAKNWD